MSNFIIKAAPDYLALSSRDFIRHVANMFEEKTYSSSLSNSKYTKLIGYACRSLFEVCMQCMYSDNLIIATTPFNHTSFRNIMEKYAKPENIHIIEMNSSINGIKSFPNIQKCDIVVLTHMFGQDMDLNGLAEFKRKHNCLVIEDRVQGGSLDLKFSDPLIDISLYSMAMDKRPIALGGGFMHVRNEYQNFIEEAKKKIAELPLEPNGNRLKEFVKKIPTFLLYNKRKFVFVFTHIINILGKFNKDINMLNITQSYRKSNPGFSHFNYMKKPSNGLLRSMHENLNNYIEMEKLYKKKHTYFLQNFSDKMQKRYFPWYNGNSSLTPYNTIYIDEKFVQKFLYFFNNYSISVIANPTYKMFNFRYDNDHLDAHFNNGIVYLPSLANMNKREMDYLSEKVKEFDVKFMKKEIINVPLCSAII